MVSKSSFLTVSRIIESGGCQGFLFEDFQGVSADDGETVVFDEYC